MIVLSGYLTLLLRSWKFFDGSKRLINIKISSRNLQSPLSCVSTFTYIDIGTYSF